MANSTFLDLTNQILQPFNEVVLTSGTFASAVGFHANCKNWINKAIWDIFTFEHTEWPFAWSSTTQLTTIGTGAYTTLSTYTAIDWDSFKIVRPSATATSVTQTAGTATFTATGNHLLLTGDSVTVSGATQSGYNGTFAITVTGATTFTYSVDSATTSPATGTITVKSNSVPQKPLSYKDIDSYRDEKYDARDANMDSPYNVPDFVVRKQDNNYIISSPPDRVYTIYYEGFTLPTALSAYTDTSPIMPAFDWLVITRAQYYAYKFRDNFEMAKLQDAEFQTGIVKMRQILCPSWQFMRA